MPFMPHMTCSEPLNAAFKSRTYERMVQTSRMPWNGADIGRARLRDLGNEYLCDEAFLIELGRGEGANFNLAPEHRNHIRTCHWIGNDPGSAAPRSSGARSNQTPATRTVSSRIAVASRLMNRRLRSG